jgi:DNA-binding GntR family transcriptional regulator
MDSLLRDTAPDTPSAPTPALGHLVYDGLLSDIASRRRGAGDRLVEATIAREMQVSRTPVREALSRLENDGLIQSVRPSGYVVICPSIDDIREIFEIRRALEPLAFAAVVARADPSEDATFTALFDGIQSADTPATFAACNIAFRGFWLQRTPNVRLRETLLRFHMQVQLVRAATLHSSAGREAARHGAQALSQAYLARDTALAHTAMQTFVDTALAYFERAEATGHLRPDHP